MKRFENDSWYKFNMDMKNKKLIIWGGGAKCREYIKLFKERYEVIAIIDNDSRKWGTELQDISIEPPSFLQKLTENYCVLITIDNPGKIAIQLETMGIVEYYSLYWLNKKEYYIRKTYTIDKLKVDKVFGYLSDLKSKEIFKSIIQKRQDGIMDYSDLMSEGEYFNSEIFLPCDNAVYVDAGSFDGDSIFKFIQYNTKFKKIFAFEPDDKNYDILRKSFIYNAYREKITLFNMALSDKEEIIDFNSGNGVSSHLIDEMNQKNDINKKVKVSCQSLDNLIDEEISFIKMDIEGAEIKALNGAKRLITMYKPDLAICIYHKENDIFEIPDLIHRMVPEYMLYIRHHGAEYTDTVLYATVKK